MREKAKMVVWPAYIDAGKSRGEGRKISKKDGVRSPKIKEITTAAKKLGLDPVAEEDKAYPRSFWEYSGRVLVDKSERKTEILRKIAKVIKEMRADAGARKR